MQPFFKYFGSKWKLARLYCRPRCEHVIEPFAGAAGYSVYWEPKKVTLIELNPVVHGVWKYPSPSVSPRSDAIAVQYHARG